MSLKFSFTALFFLLTHFAFSQTNVSGTISTDTTWTLANSPYTITNHILVDTGATLTVEAGVIVNFNFRKKLEVKGGIVAIGSPSSRIKFQANGFSNSWDGIFLYDQSKDAITDSLGNYISGNTFQYVDISGGGWHAYNSGTRGMLELYSCSAFINNANITNSANCGIRITKLSNSSNDSITPIYIDDSNVSGHFQTGISCGYPGLKLKLVITNTRIGGNSWYGVSGGFSSHGSAGHIELISCLVENNYFQGASFAGGAASNGYDGGVIVKDNIFKGNGDYGLTVSGSAYHTISSNIFLDHHEKALTLWGAANKTIHRNVFVDNGNSIISHATTSNLSIKWNHFYDNYNSVPCCANEQQVQINAGTLSENMFAKNYGTQELLSLQANGVTSPRQINFNNFFQDSTQTIIQNHASLTVPENATNNFWNVNTTTGIDAQIHDFNDNSSLGVVNYSPYLTEPDTNAPISPPRIVIKSLANGLVTLNWPKNPEADVAGYKIYWGGSTGYSYTSVVDVGNVQSHSLAGVTNLNAEFSVVAYDNQADGFNDVADGHQSWFSIAEEYAVPFTSNSTVSSINGFEIPCHGAANGQVSISATGGTPPYSYEWSHDPTLDSNSLSNLDTGSYTVIVRDALQFAITHNFTLTQPADSLSISSINLYRPSCSNKNDGVLAFKINGGIPPYSIAVTDSTGFLVGIVDSVFNRWPGTYKISVTDANNCNVTIDGLQLGYDHLTLKPIISSVDTAVCDGGTTTASLNPGIVSATWNDNGTGVVRNIGVGSWWLTSTDTNGCSIQSDTITIQTLIAKDTSAQICLATFDQATGKNKLIFDKPDNESGIGSYNIYKDIFGVWQIIGSVNSGDSSQFIDVNSQPNSKVAKYYIETEDICNVSYSATTVHKTVLLQSSLGSTGEVNLIWNLYEGAQVWYYRILRKVWNSPYVAIDSIGNVFNTYIDNNPPTGTTSYKIEAVLFQTCQVKAKTGPINNISSNSVTENTIGLEENPAILFRIYPNPTQNILNIEYTGDPEHKSIQFYDTNGKLLFKQLTDQNLIELDISDLPKGLYQLKINLDHAVIHKSIIKK